MSFNYNQKFNSIDFRERPELYQVGQGEQGVLLVEPYKSELLPLWRFKNEILARESAKSITQAFHRYRKENDFVGMDMARKYLQMGFSRSRRYANHSSGKKYLGSVPKKLQGISGAHGRSVLPLTPDKEKAKSALIFKKAWDKVESCIEYQELKADWKLWYG